MNTRMLDYKFFRISLFPFLSLKDLTALGITSVRTLQQVNIINVTETQEKLSASILKDAKQNALFWHLDCNSINEIEEKTTELLYQFSLRGRINSYCFDSHHSFSNKNCCVSDDSQKGMGWGAVVGWACQIFACMITPPSVAFDLCSCPAILAFGAGGCVTGCTIGTGVTAYKVFQNEKKDYEEKSKTTYSPLKLFDARCKRFRLFEALATPEEKKTEMQEQLVRGYLSR